MARRVWRIAHRGASGEAPEHTRAAFRLALRQAADGIECDVRLTRDGVPVLWHDARLERTSDGRGTLRGLPLRRLRRLDCGRWFGPRFAGERALTLAEALRLVRGRALLHIEIKTDRRQPARPVTTRVIRCVRRQRAARRVLLSSFDPAVLAQIRRQAPRLRCALIAARAPRRCLRRARALGAVAIHPHAALATAAFIRRAHALGLAVHVWTADRPRQIARLLARGAEGIISNHPRRVPRWWPA